MSDFDTTKKVTAENLLDLLLGHALDPSQMLREARQWAEGHLAPAVAAPPAKTEKAKKSGRKAA